MMNSQKKPLFLVRKYYSILKASIVMEAATFLVSFTDTLIAGNFIGEEAIAAVGLSVPSPDSKVRVEKLSYHYRL